MANLKSGNAIVRLLLRHGEKIGMAGIVVCAGMLFWSAIGRERLGGDRQPENLVKLADNANRHVLSFTWDNLPEEEVIRAETISGEAMEQVVAEHYPRWKYPMNRPVLDPVSLRTDPALLLAEELEVHGDSGLWASADKAIIEKQRLAALAEQQKQAKADKAAEDRRRADDPSERGGRGAGIFGGGRGEQTERGGRTTPRRDGPIVVNPNSSARLQGFEQISAKSWVTVLAKVPVEKQYEIYDEALQGSSGYDNGRDIPIYRGYVVERAEITETGQGEWKKIASVNSRSLDRELESYPFDALDLIDPRYNHPILTHPLPPLILRDWDKRVSHSSMPLASEAEPEGSRELEEAEESDEPAGEEDMFAGPAGGRRGEIPGGGYGGRTGRGERGGRMEGGYPGGGYGGRGEMGYGGEYGGGRMEMGQGGAYGGRGGMMGGGRSGSVGVFSWDGKTTHVLFRYFDDNVEPGHQYRYRVRLALADVNHDVNEKHLDRTVLDRRSKIENKSLKKFRLTDWSEPSPVASVPLPARIYLVSAEAANENNFSDEPEAKILVKAFNSTLPAEIALEEDFARGSVLNLQEKAKVIWADSTKLEPEQEKEEFNFRTGITVIDFRGGEKLSRDMTAPARALLMDPSGRLFLQEELDDSEPVAEYQQVIEGGDQRGGRNSPYGGGRGEGGGYGDPYGEMGGYGER